MAYDLLTFGEALVEIMRTDVDQPLDRPGPFVGPYPSGAPFIFTVQAARLGARAACVGAVGGDAFGRFLLDSFAADGLDTSIIRVIPDHATGVAFIAYARDGSRDFVYHLRHAAAGHIGPQSLQREMFTGLKCLHLTGSSLSMHEDAYQLGLQALAWAQEAGARISFDPNLRPQLIDLKQAASRFAPFIDASDVILLTQEELTALTGHGAEADGAVALIGGKAGRIVVVHAGDQGSRVYQMGLCGLEAVSAAPFPVRAIDPTGAGDCFDAGFLVRWLAGADPVDAARYANACGALACTEKGPMAGAKSAAEVEAFMQAHRE
ncbi:MAG: sugar kinase [Candidatus Flexifilum sp.]|jgi:sugar/nucleoside kinase (ribokinase family)